MDAIRSLLDLFDIANYLPNLTLFAGTAKLILWILMLVGPALMTLLGLTYYLKPPAEANFSWGFRTYFGMGSVEAWRYTQKVAGLCWIVVGGAMAAVILGMGLFMLALNAGQAAVMAMWAVGIELVLIIASWVFINILVLRKYDRHGNPRYEEA